MFEDAIRYPYDEGEGLRALAIGGVLTLLSFLLVPVFVVSGYTIRVLRDVVGGEEHLPSFDGPAELFVDGLKALVVGFVYLLVPSILLGLAVAAFLVPLSTPVPRWISAIAVVVALVSLPSVFLVLYVLPAGLVNLARTGRMGSAFAVRRMWPVLSSGSYFVAWLLALVVLVVSSAVTSAIGVVTLVGLVLVAFVGFYANLVAAYLYARGFAAAVPVTTDTEGDATGSVV